MVSLQQVKSHFHYCLLQARQVTAPELHGWIFGVSTTSDTIFLCFEDITLLN